MGGEAILGLGTDFEERLARKIDDYFSDRGSENQRAIQTMKQKYEVMRSFLNALK